MSDNSFELINEYKEQVRILKQEVAELQDAGKSKDAANKRCLQKLEHSHEIGRNNLFNASQSQTHPLCFVLLNRKSSPEGTVNQLWSKNRQN